MRRGFYMQLSFRTVWKVFAPWRGRSAHLPHDKEVIIWKIAGRRVANKSHLPTERISYHSVGGWRFRHNRGPTAMYVCLCNALTDRQVKQAAASAGTIKPSSVYAACGCRAQCGQCVKALLTLLRGGDCAIPELQGAN